PAVDQNLAAKRRDQPEQCLEQGRLARPVGTQQAEHFAAPNGEVYAVGDEAPFVTDRQVRGLQHFRRLPQLQDRLPRASSHTNTGAPRRAVRSPRGISMRAAVRATVSISTRKAPPISTAAGSTRS